MPITAWSGTVLSVTPARAVVGVTVVPTSGRAQVTASLTRPAASTSALMPRSGSRPACAARPVICTTYPDLLVGGEEQARGVLSDPRAEEGEPRDRLHNAGLHVEDTGTAHLVTVDAPGNAREGAEGPDGVEVTEKQDCGAVGPPPQDRSSAVLDDAGRGAEPVRDLARRDIDARAAGVDIGAGGLGLDEDAQGLDHPGGEIPCGGEQVGGCGHGSIVPHRDTAPRGGAPPGRSLVSADGGVDGGRDTAAASACGEARLQRGAAGMVTRLDRVASPVK